MGLRNVNTGIAPGIFYFFNLLTYVLCIPQWYCQMFKYNAHQCMQVCVCEGVGVGGLM